MTPKHVNLLIFIHEFPPIIGGASNACGSLTKEFIKSGIQVTVVTSGERYEDSTNADGVKVTRLPTFRKIHEKPKKWKTLLYFFLTCFFIFKLRKYQFNAVLGFFTFPGGLIAGLFSYFYKIPYFVSVRGTDLHQFGEQNLIFTIMWYLNRFLLPRAAMTFCTGYLLYKIANELAPKANKIMVPNGVDLEFYKQHKIPVVPKKRKIVYAGRMESPKGILELLSVLKQIKLDNIEITLVGDGSESRKVENFLKFNKSDKIKYYRALSRFELKKIFDENDILLLLSKFEGCSNILMEAMASGLAIIANDVIGTKEWIEGNGLLIKADAENIMLALEHIKKINDIDLKVMGKKSRIIVEKYSWEEIAGMYREVISNNLLSG